MDLSHLPLRSSKETLATQLSLLPSQVAAGGLVAKSCLTLCHPHGLQPARLLCPWDFPGKNTGAGCHFLLQGILPTQGSNLGLLQCRRILYQLPMREATGGYSHNILMQFDDSPQVTEQHPVVRTSPAGVDKALSPYALLQRMDSPDLYCIAPRTVLRKRGSHDCWRNG